MKTLLLATAALVGRSLGPAFPASCCGGNTGGCCCDTTAMRDPAGEAPAHGGHPMTPQP